MRQVPAGHRQYKQGAEDVREVPEGHRQDKQVQIMLEKFQQVVDKINGTLGVQGKIQQVIDREV